MVDAYAAGSPGNPGNAICQGYLGLPAPREMLCHLPFAAAQQLVGSRALVYGLGFRV